MTYHGVIVPSDIQYNNWPSELPKPTEQECSRAADQLEQELSEALKSLGEKLPRWNELLDTTRMTV